MPLSIRQVFGSSATQDASTLVVRKEDLALVGLTPGANNSAESLFAAAVLLLARSLRGKVKTQDGEAIATDLGDLEYRVIEPDAKVDCYYWDRTLPLVNKNRVLQDVFVIEIVHQNSEPGLPLEPHTF